MTTFNAEAFLNATAEGAMETRRTPIPDKPEGYIAIIDDLKPKMINDQVAVDIFWLIDDAALAEQLSLKKVTVRQTVFLDIDAYGKLEIGTNKNVQLGRVREAVGLNTPGKPFQLAMLKGAGPARIMVSNDPDKKDPTIIYDNVKAVTKLGA
jgi:hypothetical protein